MVRPTQAHRAPNRAEPANGTRRRILEAARELFAQHGYTATSIRMIARRCGLTDPAVHYHFRTKSDIYDALLVGPEYDLAPPGAETASRLAMAAFMEQRFRWWTQELDFLRLLLREQIRGRPGSLAYLHDQEALYHEEVAQGLRALYGEAASTVSELAWFTLAGALWDAVMTYGTDAAEVVNQDYFMARIRRLIDAILDAGEALGRE